MMSPDHFNPKLHQLLCQLIDREPTAEVMQQIEALVLADPHAVRQYLEFVQLDSAAELLHANAELLNDGSSAEYVPQSSRSPEPCHPLLLFPAPDTSEVISSSGLEAKVGVSRATGYSNWGRVLAAIGSVAVLLGGILFGAWSFFKGDSAVSVATLVGTQGCRWESDGVGHQINPGSRLQIGKLRLTEGLAELVFDCGAQVVMEGPADFELTGPKSATAWRGRLVAKVPPAAVGFFIDTPDARIVDFGTEFAISVEESQATEVHVIAGKVEIEPVAVVSRGEFPQELLTGQAVRLDQQSKGLPQRVELADKRFVRSVRFGYGLYPPSLLSYWSFDEALEGSRIIDRAGTNHGNFEGSVHRVEGLVGQGAARFTDTDGDLMNVGPDFNFTTGITIEALIACEWDGKFDPEAGAEVYPEAGVYDEIFRKEDGKQRVLLSFQHDNQLKSKAFPDVPAGPVLAFGLNIGGEYTELDMPLDGKSGRPALAELCDGRMHHVVATYDSATGEKAIFIDGRKRFFTHFPRGKLIESGGSVSAGIGGWYPSWAKGETSVSAEPFTGLIDEVAIYRSALSDREIAQHYERGLVGQSYFANMHGENLDETEIVNTE